MRNEALKIIDNLIVNNSTHTYYKEVCELASEYKAHISGKGIDKYLKQFSPRESDIMFEQRKRLTNSITPAIASSLSKPFNKVARNDRIKSEFIIPDNSQRHVIEKMIDNFYGSTEVTAKGLDYWFKTRFVELSFMDPNAWIVVEWEPEAVTNIIKPYPFEVSSEEALNFQLNKGCLQWLFCKTCIQIKALSDKGYKNIEGIKYSLYHKDFFISLTQVDSSLLQDLDITDNENLIKIKNNNYIVKFVENRTGLVPAFRIGYQHDLGTNSKTFVNPFHQAMTYFRKSLKTVSELDLTMTLHAFPLRVSYETPCRGIDKDHICDQGRLITDGSICKLCNGTGIKSSTSTQEEIKLELPEDKDQYFDLDNIVKYISPPVELIEFQEKYVRNLKTDCHYAVFNSNMFLSEEAQFAKTATEVDINMDGIFDAIVPYTEKISDAWVTIVYYFLKIAGIKIDDKIKVIHEFPSDLKLTSKSTLLKELELINSSNAPSFMRDSVQNELAKKTFSENEIALKWYETRHKFFPFNGKSESEIALLLSSSYVSIRTKILYANFESIFTDIQKEDSSFYERDYNYQWEVVERTLNVYIEEINNNSTLENRIDFDPIYKNEQE